MSYFEVDSELLATFPQPGPPPATAGATLLSVPDLQVQSLVSMQC